MKIKTKINLIFMSVFFVNMAFLCFVLFFLVNNDRTIFLYFDFFRIFLFLFFIFFFIFCIITCYASKIIMAPMEDLKKGVEFVEKGNFDYKVGISADDEVGKISRSFDKMTQAVTISEIDIDKRVKDQTREIKKKQKAILSVLGEVEREKDKVLRERDKMNTILYSIGDGVFVVDMDLKIIAFNKAAEELSGFSVMEVAGKKYDNFLKFVYEDGDSVTNDFIKNTIKTGKLRKMTNHALLILKNGEKLPVANSAAPLKDKNGEIFGCVVVFMDVTKERKMDKAKTEFVSLASHQLRTPLSAINWYTEMLLDGDAGKMNKKQKEYLNQVYKGGQRMNNLINALLNISRLELGTFVIELKKIDLNIVINNILKELSFEIKDKKIKIIKEIDVSASEYYADPSLINIIFQNILSNAVKYGDKSGKIRIVLRKEKDDIIFNIENRGLGIPKKQEKDVFKKFFRADNVRKINTDGNGLGLYIVKSILSKVGGDVWFESIENEKTNFYVILPRSGMKFNKKLNKKINSKV